MATILADINRASEAAVHRHQNQIEIFTNTIAVRLTSFHRIALRRVGNSADAEDAVQDALLSAYTHLDRFKGEAKLSTWITAIVINSAGALVRRRSRQLHIPLDGQDQQQNHYSFSETFPDRRPSPEEVCLRLEIANKLEQLSKQLSPMLSRTLELRYVHGLSIREMARVQGVSEGAAKTRLSRSRLKLRKMLRENPEAALS